MKKLRNFLVAIMITVCAVTLVACGAEAQLDTKATVNAGGNYQTVSSVAAVSETKSAVYESGSSKVETTATGYKATVVKSLGTTLLSYSTDSTFIYKSNGDNADEFAMKSILTFGTGDNKVESTLYIYYKDNTYYLNGSYNNKVVDRVKITSTASLGGYAELTGIVSTTINADAIVKGFVDAVSIDANIATENAKLALSKATEGNETRLKLEAAASGSVVTGYASVYAFLSYETTSLKLIGYQCKLVGSTTNASATTDITVSQFNDEIDYPSDLSSYTA